MNEIKIPEWVATVKQFWGLVGTALVVLGIDVSFLSEEFFTTAYLDQIIGGVVAVIGAGIAFYNVVKRGISRPGTVQSLSEVSPEQVKSRFNLLNPFGSRYAIG